MRSRNVDICTPPAHYVAFIVSVDRVVHNSQEYVRTDSLVIDAAGDGRFPLPMSRFVT